MRNVTVKAYEHDSNNDLSVRLAEFQHWLVCLIATIPAEYRDSAMIEISADTYFDCAKLEIVITYQRPENDQERAAREREETKRAEAQKTHEIDLLRQLKAKYDQ